MTRILVALALLFAFTLSAAAQQAQLVMVTGGDSLMGCARDWFFPYLGATTKGLCSDPVSQSQAVYIANSNKIVAVNMGISSTQLETGANNFVAVASAYIAPITRYKTVSGFGGGSSVAPARTYAVICGIGTNDQVVGTYGNPTTYFAHHADACAALKASGFDKAIMTTVMPRADGSMNAPNWATYNGLVNDPAARAAHNIDGVIDIASETTCGNLANFPANNGATFTGSISGTTMTVTATGSSIPTGASTTALYGVGVTLNTTIVTQLTGTPGDTGTYQVSVSQTVASTTLRWGLTTYYDTDNLHYNATCGALIATNVVGPAMRAMFPGLAMP